MSSRKFWGILVGLAGALLLHQGYHWLEKEWSTAILSEGDDVASESESDSVSPYHDEESQGPNSPSDQDENGETHQNQFGVAGPSLT